MNMTALNLTPVRHDLSAEAGAFRPRRFSDPVSPVNAPIYDRVRLLANAVELADHLGLEILSAEAQYGHRNSHLHVVAGPACDALGGAQVGRSAGYSHWCANVKGTEIRWCIPVEAA